MNKIEIELSKAAQEFADETGSNPNADVAMLVSRGPHNAWFLGECLSGCDDDRLDGAHEYYHAIAAAADRAREADQLPFGLDRPEALSEPFCACGHVISLCDGSRKGCRKHKSR